MTYTDEINQHPISGFTPGQLETLLSAMHDLVFVLDHQRIFIHCFQSTSSDLLIPVELFIGKPIGQVPFPPEVLQILDQAMTEVAATGKTKSVDYHLLLPAEVKWFNCNISLIPASGEDKGGFLAIARDITDKTNAMLALQASEKQLSLLTNNINDLVALYDTDGILEYISPSVKPLLGYQPGELIGKSITIIVHPEDAEMMSREFTPGLFPQEQSYITEYRLKHISGQWLYFETNRKFICNEAGIVTSIVATCHDISARKKAEQALKESEEIYRSLVESSPAIIMLLDRNGNYLFSNSNAVKFAETYYRDGVERNNIKHFISGDAGKQLIAALHHSIDENEGHTLDAAIIRNGKKIWFRVSLQPVLDSSRKPYAALMNAINITENIEYRELLEAQNKELQEINFLQTHTIRSPLTNIQALLNLVHMEELGNDNLTYLNLLRLATSQLDEVIKQVVSKASKLLPPP